MLSSKNWPLSLISRDVTSAHWLEACVGYTFVSRVYYRDNHGFLKNEGSQMARKGDCDVDFWNCSIS